MGVNANIVRFLVYEHEARGPLGRVLTLGHQDLLASPRDLRPLVGEGFESDHYADRLLVDCFGATSVDSMDNSPFEGATVVHDLNQPLTAPVEPFDTVIDAGTTEHVFDIPRALKTVTELCRPGGRILHFVPANQNCGHGFWQFSPELFFSLYSERNGYADTEVFATHFPRSQRWWRVSPPEPGKRVNLNSVRDLYLVCRTTPGESVSSDPVVQQSDYIHMWNRDEQPTQNGVVDRLKRSPLRPVLAPISRQYTASRRRVGRFNPSLERVRSDALGGR